MINLNPKENDASCVLDFIRAAAAQAVCVGHALNFFGVDRLKPHFYMQNVAVCVFFLLSGLLIATTLVNRSTRSASYGFTEYLIDRVARIHSALLPSLVLVAIIDASLLYAGLYEFPNYFTVPTFIANVLCLQGYSGIFEGALRHSSFGSDGPLWTLGVEFQIYLFVGSLFFLFRGSKWWAALIPVALFFGQTTVIYLYGSQQPNVGTALFSLWLVGFALAFVLDDRRFKIAPLICAIAAVLSTWAYLRPLLYGNEYDVRFYPLLIVAFASVIGTALRTRLTVGTRIPKIVSAFADYSFTLYLIHYTILYAIYRVWPDAGIAGAFAGIVISNIAAATLAHFTEVKHRTVATAMKQLFTAPRLKEKMSNADPS